MINHQIWGYDTAIWPGIFLATFGFQVWIPQLLMVSLWKFMDFLGFPLPRWSLLKGNKWWFGFPCSTLLSFAVLDGVYPCTWRSMFSFIPETYTSTWLPQTKNTDLRLWGQVLAIKVLIWCFLHPTSGWTYSGSTRNWDKHNWVSGEGLLNVFRAWMEELIEHILSGQTQKTTMEGRLLEFRHENIRWLGACYRSSVY